ncbi:hypothetical protein DSO57_1008401 [Entomophthora muscae]|uniref:Uncharacterized protein n=2 Tax=Entomophthora muscae TaxID=34485 RepID=A0ACC2RH65_9FUNG|nr:hypothetical protein DSO57_1024446 [Entomophthora muscae]KAJ9078271.1 hypothetical protein DSO57_1008401 [Entomophthora muscae]
MSAKPVADASKDAPVVTDISNSDVILKYNAASTIAKSAMEAVVQKCTPGTKLIDICSFGDQFILDETSKVFKGKKIAKGIAFPTCISLNQLCSHVSPLSSDPEANIELKKGDLVKIELGAQIDGFPGVLGHSFVVGASKEEPATGKHADVVLAAHHSVEAASRLLRPGNKNFLVTEAVQKVCEAYGTKPAEGSLSYQVEKDILEGTKQIIFNPNDQQRQGFKSCEFAANEVYCVAVYASSGEGKMKETSVRTTVYKRTDSTYSLKLKAARAVHSAIKPFGKFPFSLRSLADEKTARMGIIECVRSRVVSAFDVTSESADEVIASFMYTILVFANGNTVATSFPVDLESYKSEKKIEDAEILDILQQDVTRKSKKSKKPKAAEQ